ncbi:MAG: transposase family protein [Bacteroidetes bacterium]|nr:MAG: transposase family protein [Bacteroidota bacterium]
MPLASGQLSRPTRTLSRDEDKLFFILYFFKTNALQEAMALQFEMNQAQVSRWIKVLLPVLSRSIIDLHLQPARTMNELVKLFHSRQRPNGPTAKWKSKVLTACI